MSGGLGLITIGRTLAVSLCDLCVFVVQIPSPQDEMSCNDHKPQRSQSSQRTHKVLHFRSFNIYRQPLVTHQNRPSRNRPKDYCGFIPTESLVDSHLKAWDKDYASRGRLWGGGVKDLPALPDGSCVLELGCGDGKTLSALHGGGNIVALDVSREALHLARRARADAHFILADATRLPLREKSFDAVFAFHVAGHLLAADRQALAAEAARVLVPGGRLFFRDFCDQDMRAGQGEEVEPGTFRRGRGIITHYFIEDEAKGLFSSLRLDHIGTHCWNMRVKGEEHLRAEVEAVFLKS
jgi:SAM-dependent methyltransferase